MTMKEIFEDFDYPLPEDPQAKLETSYIEAFLAGKGYRWSDLASLLPEEVKALMTEACTYASNKLAEVETRSRLVHGLHGKD